MTDRRVHNKIQLLWESWPRLKDTTTAFDFRAFLKAEHGFSYKGVRLQNSETIAVVDKIYDQEKYMWFLLQC